MRRDDFDQIVTIQDEFGDSFDMCILYYQVNKLKMAFYCFLVFLSLGFLYIIQRWSLTLKILLQYSPCQYSQATHIFIRQYKNGINCSDDVLIHIVEKNICKIGTVKLIVYHCLQYYFNPDDHNLILLKSDINDNTSSNINGLQTQNEYQSLLDTYGYNLMDIPIKSVPLLLLDEILTPFNLFQLIALLLWSFDSYLMYALMLGILTIIEIILSLIELRNNLHKIRAMILFETEVRVLRFGQIIETSSKMLVPGDILLLTPYDKLPCDCTLLQGTCVMNEAILTGESIPVNKQPGTQLYGGTTCLIENNAKAIVTQTGFLTVKGGLARTILFIRNETFSFNRDSMRYLLVLGTIGLIELIISLIVGVRQGFSFFDSLVNGLELVTICVPPTLPTALGAGIHLAVERLHKNRIYCVKPDKVNVSGKVNLSLFDKTGTLTELGLDVKGFVTKLDKFLQVEEVDQLFYECILACNSLSQINGKLDGDPMDLAMFNETKWAYTESTQNKELAIIEKGEFEPIYIIKRFDFDASLQRMSVICQRNRQTKIYCKGSPEVMNKLCKDEVPEQIYQKYAKEGYRVIACGGKQLSSIDSPRSECEKDLDFLGFVIFENRVKVETKEAILTLNEANIKSMMVTGDNALTAINIAQKCGIVNSTIYLANKLLEEDVGETGVNRIIWNENIDEKAYNTDQMIQKLSEEKISLSMTGQIFNYLIQIQDKKIVQQILEHTYVYARMKPNDKGNLVLQLKQNPLNLVSFIGDGTNDTCALRNADVGMALSTEDASLAAPFTSLQFNIAPVITLLKEGRASLVTSIECFKFMTLYSVIQSSAVLMLYFTSCDMTNAQYLYQDLWMIIPLALTMNMTKAYSKLAPYRPVSDLLSLPVLASVIGLILICVAMQIVVLLWLMSQPFYRPYSKLDPHYLTEDIEKVGFENSVLIIVSNAQVLSVAIAFTQGPPFRQKISENCYFIYTIIIALSAQLIVIIYPEGFQFIDLCRIMPIDFRIQLTVFALLLSVIIISYEKVVTQKLVLHYSKNEMSIK